MTGLLAHLRAAVSDIIMSAKVTGDVNDRFTLTTGGTLGWGPATAAVDATLKRTGAGAMALSALLGVFAGTSVTTGAPSRHVHVIDDAIATIGLDTYNPGAATAPQFLATKGRGTFAAPADVVDGDILFTLAARGVANGGNRQAASISVAVEGTPTGGNLPGRLELRTGSTVSSPVTRLSVNPDGATIVGCIDLVEQTAPTTPATNHARVYAKDDGAGATQLMARFATGSDVALATQGAATYEAAGTAVLKSLADAKGDLFLATANDTVARQAVGNNGESLVANSNDTNGARWAKTSFSLMRSGSYNTMAGTQSTAALLTNRLFYQPIFVSRRLTFDRVALYHSSVLGGALSVARLGIYASANDVPSTLILDAGTIDTSTAAAVKAITISQMLDPGLYFLAAVSQPTSGAPQFGVVTAPVLPVPDPGGMAGGAYAQDIVSTLPSTAAPFASAVLSPNIYLRTA